MGISILFRNFISSEKAGGFVLILCTIVSLIVTNSPIGEQYLNVWHFQLAGKPLEFWINDGLMTIFFLLIGLELEREIYSGELSNLKGALLPVATAIGGMLVPAAIYLMFTHNTGYEPGAGIPMATDIAFAIGILSLAGNRIPISVKILLTALAVIDDLGAILVIAFFYTSSLSWTNLLAAAATFAALLIMNRLRVRNLIPYLVGGVAMWYFMLSSGVHPTITGVLLAFAIPYGDGSSKSTSYILQNFLHLPVAFIILPLFALANTCIVINTGWSEHLMSAGSLGIAVGLIIGKPVGIVLAGYIAVALGVCSLPPDIRWKHVWGIGFLGGVGFTMSVFITLLAFGDASIINQSKMAIVAASCISALLGFFWLRASVGRIRTAKPLS